MADSSGLNIFGAISGAIGTVTGIAGFVLGYIGYRRSKQFKSLDLRIELRKAQSNLHTLADELPKLLEKAKQSRIAVSSAMGTSGTGWLEAWKEQLRQDADEIQLLARGLPAPSDHAHSSYSELESKLVAVHNLQSRCGRLRDKYLAEIQKDDHDRDHIREDMRTRLENRKR